MNWLFKYYVTALPGGSAPPPSKSGVLVWPPPLGSEARPPRLAASQSEMAALKAELVASKQAAGILASIGQGQQQQNATVGDSLADLVADEEAKRLVREAVNASAVNAIDHGAEEEEDAGFLRCRRRPRPRRGPFQ